MVGPIPKKAVLGAGLGKYRLREIFINTRFSFASWSAMMTAKGVIMIVVGDALNEPLRQVGRSSHCIRPKNVQTRLCRIIC